MMTMSLILDNSLVLSSHTSHFYPALMFVDTSISGRFLFQSFKMYWFALFRFSSVSTLICTGRSYSVTNMDKPKEWWLSN